MIAEVNRLVPNKPIRAISSDTHYHMDQPRRRPAYVVFRKAPSIVTHESNKQYYLDIMLYPLPRRCSRVIHSR